MAEMVSPKTCKGCNGTGEVPRASGIPGFHFRCNGTGVVETNRAANAAAKAAHARLLSVPGVLLDLSGSIPRYSKASRGLQKLSETEPDRYAKACDSILARREDVVDALIAYGHIPGSRL